jgi:ubiquitin C
MTIKIYVQYHGQTPIEYQVDPLQPIHQIRTGDMIIYNQTLLNTQETFHFYNIDNESILYVMKSDINVSIQRIDGLTHIQLSPIQHIQDHFQKNYQLVYNGRLLTTEKTLFELGIFDDIIVFIQDTVVFINHKKKKKTRCSFQQCSDKICKMIGTCSYCQTNYCSRHRLPEAHVCINLSSCKRVAHERNSEKLYSERCVASKLL